MTGMMHIVVITTVVIIDTGDITTTIADSEAHREKPAMTFW